MMKRYVLIYTKEEQFEGLSRTTIKEKFFIDLHDARLCAESLEKELKPIGIYELIDNYFD